MKFILKLLSSIIMVLLFAACASSNISYYNNKLSLQINDAYFQIHGTQLERKRDNFSSFFLTQNLLRLDDNSLIVYEEGQTDIQYQFKFATARTIGIIFDAKRVVKVYYNTLIYAFQVVLKDDRVLNVIASQGFDQELQMVYGMSAEQLNVMLQTLDQNVQPVSYTNVINLAKEPTPYMSKWTTWKVHFVPLVVPLRLRWPY